MSMERHFRFGYSFPVYEEPIPLPKIPPADRQALEEPPAWCPLCTCAMEKKSGRYGTFYSCTAWRKTGCSATLGPDKVPGKKTQKLLEEREIKRKEAEEIAAIGQATGNLEIE